MIGIIPMDDDMFEEGYSCPIYYSCYEEEGITYCQENTSGQYECKSNLSVGEK
jgi:radical SAM superfamily enzyme